eukprot:4016709-Pyramimonas_sp.AAC.1
MAVYGCASNTPSPKCLTYGCAHTWDPAYSTNPPNFQSQWLQEHIPANSQNFHFLLSMAVYGCTHVSYGRTLDVTPA